MKTRFITLISVGIITLLAFLACNIDGESNYTPTISFYANPVVKNGDTLNIRYTDEASVYQLDTIAVGDTVSFVMFMDGFANGLTAFYLNKVDDGKAQLVLPRTTALDSVFLPTSSYETGKFFMDGSSTALFFPFQYVAVAPTNDTRITFTVVSDANFKNSLGSNIASFSLKTPIKAAPVEVE